MSNLIGRLPKSLDILATDIQKEVMNREGKIIPKTKALEKVREFALPNFFMWKNKKGQIADFFAVIVIILVAILLFSVILMGVNIFNDANNEHETNVDVRNMVDEEATSLPSWFDFGFAMLFFLIFLVLILLNFILQTNIQLIILYLFSVFFMGPAFIIGHNALNSVRIAFPGVFLNLPLTCFIIDQFFIIMALYYLFLFMMLFIKPNTAR